MPASAKPGAGWLFLSWLFCLLGMGTKEVMVSAPVLVLLYDRTFAAGSFREAWRKRRRYYSGLGATWLWLAWLVAGSHGRNGTAGFGVPVSWGNYWLAQGPAIAAYLRLAVWPAGQVFDYGPRWAKGAADVLPGAAAVLLLAGGTAVALKRRPAWGFLGAWFFAILAPTSIMPGIRQTMAEHRMYLALAPLCVAAGLGLARLGRPGRWAGLLIAVFLLGLTVRRNEAYATELALWADTAARVPDNAFAQQNYGAALFAQGRVPEAEERYRAALKLDPNLPQTRDNLGFILGGSGRTDEAVAQFREALRLQTDFPEARRHLASALENRGAALLRQGSLDEAVAPYEEALVYAPDDAAAHNDLGIALVRSGHRPEASLQFQEAVRLDPSRPFFHANLGNALASEGRREEAAREYEAALRLDPSLAQARAALERLRAGSR